jgi:hypothetical protein
VNNQSLHIEHNSVQNISHRYSLTKSNTLLTSHFAMFGSHFFLSLNNLDMSLISEVFHCSITLLLQWKNVNNLLWEIYNFNSKEEQVVDEQIHF